MSSTLTESLWITLVVWIFLIIIAFRFKKTFYQIMGAFVGFFFCLICFQNSLNLLALAMLGLNLAVLIEAFLEW